MEEEVAGTPPGFRGAAPKDAPSTVSQPAMRACFAATILATVLARTVNSRNPPSYHRVRLNDHCKSHTNAKEVLMNTTSDWSSAIVSATQLRDHRGGGRDGCKFELVTTATAGLILSVEEMNLRVGILNETCIDYVEITTKFSSLSSPDRTSCGRIHREQNIHWTFTHGLIINLHAKTPISYFVEGPVVKIVVTSYADPKDGSCGPMEFLCDGDRCIFEEYRCDGHNNCGDNSDEALFGNSECLMPRSSLIFISLGIANFIITWSSVFYCCVRSAFSKKVALQEERWETATPPLMHVIGTVHLGELSTEAVCSPDVADALGAVPTTMDSETVVGDRRPVSSPSSVRRKKSGSLSRRDTVSPDNWNPPVVEN